MLTEAKRIREQMSILRGVMREQMERDFITKSADFRMRLEDMAYDLYSSGTSVAECGRQIGTSNWRTVKDMIDRAQARHGNVTAAIDPSLTFAVVPTEHGYRVTTYDNWRSLDGEKFMGAVDLWIEPDREYRGSKIPGGPQFANTTVPGTPLHKELVAWDTASPVVARLLELEKEN